MFTSGLVTERQQLAYLLRGSTPAEEGNQRASRVIKAGRRTRKAAAAAAAAAALAEGAEGAGRTPQKKGANPRDSGSSSASSSSSAATAAVAAAGAAAGESDDGEANAESRVVKKAYERFENGTTYLGWWRKDTEKVFSDSGDSWLSDGFGIQHTAECDGGWVYAGLYSENDRHGFGEIRYAREKKNSLWSEECGARIVGFWNADKLHGPVWRFYPKGSRHYRGRKDSGGGHVTFAWFLRGMLLKESEYFVYDAQPKKHRIILNYVRRLAATTNDITLRNLEEREAHFHSLAGALSNAMLHLANGFNRVAVSDVELANRLRTFSEKSKMWLTRNLSEDDGRGLEELDQLAQMPLVSPSSAAAASAASPKRSAFGKDSSAFELSAGLDGHVKYFDEYGLATVSTPTHARVSDDSTPVAPVRRRRRNNLLSPEATQTDSENLGGPCATPLAPDAKRASPHARSRSSRKSLVLTDEGSDSIRKKLLLSSASKASKKMKKKKSAHAADAEAVTTPDGQDVNTKKFSKKKSKGKRTSVKETLQTAADNTAQNTDLPLKQPTSSGSPRQPAAPKTPQASSVAALKKLPIKRKGSSKASNSDADDSTPLTKVTKRRADSIVSEASKQEQHVKAKSRRSTKPSRVSTEKDGKTKTKKRSGSRSEAPFEAARAKGVGTKNSGKNAAKESEKECENVQTVPTLSPAELRAQALARAEAMEAAALASAAAAEAAAEGLRKIAARDAAVAKVLRLQAQWNSTVPAAILGLGPEGSRSSHHHNDGHVVSPSWVASRPIGATTTVEQHCDADWQDARDSVLQNPLIAQRRSPSARKLSKEEQLQHKHQLQRDAVVRQYVNARTQHLPRADQQTQASQPRSFSFSDACHTLATGLGFHSETRLAAIAAAQQHYNSSDHVGCILDLCSFDTVHLAEVFVAYCANP